MRIGIILLLGLAATRLFATTYNLADSAQATFNTAYTTASTGDTIVFPPNGSATWSASSTISKAITINGNGTTLTLGATLNNGLFYVTNFTSTALMRITGFTMNAVTLTSETKCIKVNDSVSLTQLRIDHNNFHHGYNAIEVGGSMGVIDHNYFYNSLGAISFTAGSREQADASWVSMAAGTANALFIEDNSFIYDANYIGSYSQESVGTYNGGKLVVRYNTWNSAAYPLDLTITPIETHGNAAGGAPSGYWQLDATSRRGQSVVEFYDNTMTGKRFDYMAIFRGSANIVFSNSVSHTDVGYQSVIFLREEEYTVFDPLRVSWPAEDQVHNTFIWSNTFEGSPQSSANIITGDPSTVIQENRDYWLHAPQSSGGYEYFTGSLNGTSDTYPTNGLGNGTMAFSSSGANAYYPYTPYQYPNPLQGGGSGSSFMSGTLTFSGNVVVK